MAAAYLFRGLIRGCALVVALVVAFDLVILVAHPDAIAVLPAVLIGAALALAAVIAIIAMIVTGRPARISRMPPPDQPTQDQFRLLC